MSYPRMTDADVVTFWVHLAQCPACQSGALTCAEGKRLVAPITQRLADAIDADAYAYAEKAWAEKMAAEQKH